MRSAICSDSAWITSVTNVARAMLCGRPVRRAAARASSHTARSICSGYPSWSTSTYVSGTVCQSATAADSMSTMSGRPFSAAVAAGSSARARTPGYMSPSVASSTPVSASDGSTCEMYRRNVAFGPRIRTPWRVS
jgi:hypothetical protein